MERTENLPAERTRNKRTRRVLRFIASHRNSVEDDVFEFEAGGNVS